MTYRSVCTRISLCLLLLAGLLLIGMQPAQAQPECPYTEDEAVADTLDPAGYYPLEVGNVWEYTEMSSANMGDPRREEIVKDTLINGNLFHKLKITIYQYDPDLITEASIQYRYLTTTDTSIVQWLQGQLEENPIRFNQDFNSCYFVSDQVLYASEGGYNRSFEIEEAGVPVSYQVAAMKSIGSSFSLIEDYAYGIGRVGSRGDPSVITNLAYAQINGHEYGTRLDSLFDIRVATEGRFVEPDTRLEVYPNPARVSAHFTLVLSHPGRAVVEVFDVLGRSVATPMQDVYLSKGEHTIDWSTRSVAPGIYVARVRLDEHPVAHTRLVVV